MNFKQINEAFEKKYFRNLNEKENIEEGIFNKKESELEIQNNVQAYIRVILINILEKAENFNENIINRIKSNSKNYVKYSDLVYVISQIAKAAALGKDYYTIQRLITLCEHGTGKINIKFDGKDKLIKELTDLYHKVKGTQDREDMKNKMADDEFRTNKRKELYSHGIKDSDYYND